jgi:hypothetical protein
MRPLAYSQVEQRAAITKFGLFNVTALPPAGEILKLLLHEALTYKCMRPSATSV